MNTDTNPDTLPLVKLLRQAADVIAGLGARPPKLPDDLRLAAVIEQAAAEECDRRGYPRGVWWRKEPKKGRPIRLAAAAAALKDGWPVARVAESIGMHHSTILYHRRRGRL